MSAPAEQPRPIMPVRSRSGSDAPHSSMRLHADPQTPPGVHSAGVPRARPSYSRRETMDATSFRKRDRAVAATATLGDDTRRRALPQLVRRRSVVRQTFGPTAWATVTGDKDEDALQRVHKWHALTLDSDAPEDHDAQDSRHEPLLGDSPKPSALEHAQQHVKRAFAFVIINVLVLIEAVPFGLAFFPSSWEDFPAPRSLGIQMFLLSSAICQAVFAAYSKFDVATGLMMCENIPFMNQISTDIHGMLSAQGRVEQALPTILVAYAASTVLVGVAFYSLGVLKLGSVIGLIPPYIIQGCIGGIGVFVTQTGVEISTGEPFHWDLAVLRRLFAAELLPMWALPLVLSLCLRALTRFIRTPMLTPIFFVLIPVGFHAALVWRGTPFPEPSTLRWFFDKEETPDWRLMWQLYDLGNVAWDVLPTQLGTFAALIVFSLIHVPINIPSLCMTTNEVADIDHELKVHGIANALSGCVGTLQNYLCYSNSALYFKCGGGGYVFRALLAVSIFAFWVIGPAAISMLPRCMAGALMLHIGTELVREAVIEPFGQLDRIEYIAVCLITFTMTAAGMTEGLLVSAVLALLTFVLQTSRVPAVKSVLHGARIRSSAWRSIAELDVLTEHAGRMHLIQLQGTLFFGNFSQVSSAISSVLSARLGDESSARPPSPPGLIYIVLDMSSITCLDTAAAKALEKTYVELRDLGVAHMALVLPKPLSGMPSSAGDPAYAGLAKTASTSAELGDVDTDRPMLHLAATLDEAVAWCEGCILARQTPSSPSLAVRPSLSLDFVLQTIAPNFASASEATDGAKLQRELLEWFEPTEVHADQVLWREGDKPQQVAVLISGTLQAEDQSGAVQVADVQGCMLGEFGLMTGERRQNTVRAITNSKLYVLSLDRWAQMQEEAPRLAFVLASVALKYAGKRLQHVAISATAQANAVPV